MERDVVGGDLEVLAVEVFLRDLVVLEFALAEMAAEQVVHFGYCVCDGLVAACGVSGELG